MSRKAVIDFGSLKVKVMLFDMPSKRLLDSSSYLTLLGKGIDESQLVRDESLGKLDEALQAVTAKLRSQDVHEVVLIGTEALRKAKNVDAVHQVIRKYLPGHTLEVIDQQKEAVLFFNAVSRTFPDRDIAAMDIGGGSVQLIYGVYDSSTGKPVVTGQHHFITGTYTLQQRYSPRNDVVSDHFDEARSVVEEAFAAVHKRAPIMIFGSSCMLDFIRSTKIPVTVEQENEVHPISVNEQSLKSLLSELRGVRPDKRDHYFPEGGYFMYGADYLLLNLTEAVRRVRPRRIYPTNLNSSYGFL